nr:lysophospholipid acyltransferase family protein [Compostimonas suwonensis]
MPDNSSAPDAPDASSASPAKPVRVRSERARPSIFWVLATLVVPILNLGVKYRFHGRKLPAQGAFVLAPNHYSEIDPVIVGAAVWKLGRLPRFMAKASLFRIPVVGAALRASGQIPVERAGSSRGNEPVKVAEQLVERGGMVIVYPEGSLTRDPELWPMRGKTGAVRVALERGIPVIPAAHWGTQHVMARYSKKISLFPRKTIDIAIGDPVDLSAFEGKPLDSATLTAATAVVMDAITVLLEGLRGEEAPAERWNPSAHNQEETGRFEP